MVCDYCGTSNEGKYFRVVFGRAVRHYCQQCARKFQRGDAMALQMALLNVADESGGYDAGKSCPFCGMRFETLQKSGRIGCAGCYQAFEREMSFLLTKINGTAQHVDEQMQEPEEQDEKTKLIFSLKGELAQAINMENYERAAELRDEIKALSMSETGGKAL